MLMLLILMKCDGAGDTEPTNASDICDWLLCNVPVINVWTQGDDEFYTDPEGTLTLHYTSY